MVKKNIFQLLLIILFSSNLQAQTAPVKHFSLKKEPTSIPSDSSGTTYFYSLSFEVADTLMLTSAKFKLKSGNDSIINQQMFSLPTLDSVYQTGISPKGLIKDGKVFYIILGNIKATSALYLFADLIDNKNRTYLDITTNN